MPFNAEAKTSTFFKPFYSSKVGYKQHRFSMATDNRFDVQVLRRGLFKPLDEPENKRCVIDRLYIASGSRYKGFGIAAVREIVRRSIKLGYGGNVFVDAEHSSHLFYLKSGFIPDRAFDSGTCFKVYKIKYGDAGTEAIIELNKCKEEADFRLLLQKHEAILIMILRDKGKIPANTKTLTIEDISSNRDFLLDVSCMKDYFIPLLLDTLEKNRGNKYIDTRDDSNWNFFSNCSMSEMGIANIDKIPFRRFEHLWPYMTHAQIHRLNELLEIPDERVILEMHEPLKLVPGYVLEEPGPVLDRGIHGLLL